MEKEEVNNPEVPNKTGSEEKGIGQVIIKDGVPEIVPRQR